MAEWLGNGLQNHAQQFDSAWHLDLLVISFSVINYVVSTSFFMPIREAQPMNLRSSSYTLWTGNPMMV